MTSAQNFSRRALLIKSAFFIITTVFYLGSPSLFSSCIYGTIYFILMLFFLQNSLSFAKINSPPWHKAISLTFCFYSQLLVIRLGKYQQTYLWIVNSIPMSCESLHPIIWLYMFFLIIKVDYAVPTSWHALSQTSHSSLLLVSFDLQLVFIYWQIMGCKNCPSHYPWNRL